MFSKAEKSFTGILFAVCAVVGVAGFLVSSRSATPQRIWFDAAGGDVIFDHAYHASLAECSACHHNMEDAGEDAPEMNCRSCHYHGEAREVVCDDPHPRCIGANCTGCHEDLAESLTSCGACHSRPGAAFEFSGRANSPLPESLVFPTDFGDVAFDHQLHCGEALGFPCEQCHHAYFGGEGMEGMEREKSCRACHHDLADQITPCDSDEIHTQCIGANCTDCHGADECGLCHEE